MPEPPPPDLPSDPGSSGKTPDATPVGLVPDVAALPDASAAPAAHGATAAHGSTAAHGGHGADVAKSGLKLGLTLGALGVVYGDIGTSPIYALRESFHLHHLAPTPGNVFGILSLIFWALVLVISVKYIAFVLKADNDGEGGIISLTSLVVPLRARLRGKRWLIVPMGLFGAALLYGDSTITPAITVLSAVEGLELIAPATTPYVIPITLVILVALFSVQYKGTGGVGKVFGPIMMLWFVVLAVLGIRWIAQAPEVLTAVNPVYAVRFFVDNGVLGFLVLGSVFLVVTGGEALYADLGHFGIVPIRNAWFAVVLPGLLLNYFGQGAMLLTHPEGFEHPFFKMAPEWALPFLVILAAMAAVIASQAVISGAFSLTMQLVQFGYLPKLAIRFTSEEHQGQIYIPAVNGMLFALCIVFVLVFRSSANLAAAYGIAVTSTMALTTILFALRLRRRRGRLVGAALVFLVCFLPIDLAFFGANAVKIMDGGWVPLALGLVLFAVMLTWKQGRQTVSDARAEGRLPLDMFLDDLARRPQTTAKGTAVFFGASPHTTPSSLLHNMKHNHVVHERNVFLEVNTVSRPRVVEANRFRCRALGPRVLLRRTRLRLRRAAERSRRPDEADDRREAGEADGHLVLRAPRAPRRDARQGQDDALAPPTLRPDAARLDRHGGLLRPACGAGDRTRRTGADVMGSVRLA